MNIKKSKISISIFLDCLVILSSAIIMFEKILSAGNITWTWQGLMSTIIGVLGVLLLKASRIYFILMDYKMPFRLFQRFYIYTSCVSLIFPYKVGELFRAYKLITYSKNMSFGFIAVIIDRLFDSIPLCLIMTYCYWDVNIEITILLKLMFVFILMIWGIYLTFPSAYKLVNHFFIFKSDTAKGIKILKLLENVKTLYKESERVIKNKTVILLILSTFSWVLEFMVAYINSYINGETSLSETILNYINAVTLEKYNMAQAQFTICAIVILFIGMMYCGFLILSEKRESINEKINCIR